MKVLKAKLIARIKRTPTVESFRFIPQEKVDFSPGQFLEMTFNEDNPGDKQLNKYLSFSSSPRREYIEVTKRLSDSPFSARLKKLISGSEVCLKLPLGNCIFKDQYEKITFLIGGIGITPVISILEYINDMKLDTRATLLYSNRTDEEIAFRGELESWRAFNDRLSVLYTVTDCQPKDATCIYGMINKDLVMENVTDVKERVCFVYGPPKMVEAMNRICLELGVSQANIRTESFIGY